METAQKRRETTTTEVEETAPPQPTDEQKTKKDLGKAMLGEIDDLLEEIDLQDAKAGSTRNSIADAMADIDAALEEGSAEDLVAAFVQRGGQ
jgi:hypothetical protein